jgi:hypothetical protein
MADRLPESVTRNINMEALHSAATKFWGAADPRAREAVQRAAEKRRSAMIEKGGILCLQSSGRWAIHRPGREPVEITSTHRRRQIRHAIRPTTINTGKI